MIIDAKVETEPRCWRVTKIDRIAPNGLVMTTLAQDRFDQIHDYIEHDKYDNIIGMWADYYSSSVLNQDEDICNITLDLFNFLGEIK